ncbi:putative hydrolase or acyltransferase of alpha/beta superfamily [Candidatus Nitrososphaera evergladensis SR1]|uniref:Putative hydrolase or acyltransferase of alpha/beta superfamily n=1 Tax=Candidatus Nitrososphaera evergladensis SR1 TaxID=1459636 RepID=A0A075MT79_9ARCH|nr:alpha/beta hydrolase [Candidatus Nitrososphaera evergladensis]AIF82524.1 putative hydrolase or acyltransferase of alpha/beta superfamily [Candidatus Nitrososphaera evergladensis SR1]
MMMALAMDFKFLQVGGLRVRYVDLGNSGSRPLLLLHGLGGAIESWTNNIDRLAKEENLRVVALDLPGFGFSDKPKMRYTIKFYVDFVAKFAKALDIAPFAVAGSSLGGHVACELALTHPDLVSKLILISPSGALPKSFKGSPALWRYVKVLKAKSVGGAKKALYAVDNKPVSDAYAKAAYDKFAMPGAKEAFLSALAGSARAPRLTISRLSKIRAPALVLWGKDDTMIPAKYVEPFVKTKNIRVVLLENCGHRPHVDRPQLFDKIVADFVKENDG